MYRFLILISLIFFSTALFADDGVKFDCKPMRGPPGPTGPTGPPGPKGLKGRQGPDGTDGTDGLQGPDGPTGPQGCIGCPGPRGNKGETGATGPQGCQGNTGLQGSRGPKGPTGPCDCPTLPFARFANFTSAPLNIPVNSVIPAGQILTGEFSGTWQITANGRVVVPENGVYLITWIVNMRLELNEEEGLMYDAIIALENSPSTTATGTIVIGSDQTAQVVGTSLQYLIEGNTIALENFSSQAIEITSSSSLLSVGAAYTLKITKLGPNS